MLYEALRGVTPLRELYHTAIYWNACDVIHAPAAEAVLRLLLLTAFAALFADRRRTASAPAGLRRSSAFRPPARCFCRCFCGTRPAAPSRFRCRFVPLLHLRFCWCFTSSR